MTQAEIEAILMYAFTQCQTEGFPLDERQKQILLQAILSFQHGELILTSSTPNPLDELTVPQRQALLKFVREQDTPERSWKVSLLNDWLTGQDSGEMQFIRDLYGVVWLERVQPIHLAQYLEAEEIKLKVGDRIEVSNSLWEWVQDDGPCQREWFSCTVIEVSEVPQGLSVSDQSNSVSCTIRFENGMEYEIQGVYEWNRYNWRWEKG